MNTRDGREYQPDYLFKINDSICIGCGRCFKVCGQQVMALKGLTNRGDVVDTDDEDAVRRVMVVMDEGACIGCGACSRVCPVDCQTHGAVDASSSAVEQISVV